MEVKIEKVSGKGAKGKSGPQQEVNVSALMEQWSQYKAHEQLILEDCVIAVESESEQYEHCKRLANLLGANLTDDIIPMYTTHIVAELLKPSLKEKLRGLQEESDRLSEKTSNLFRLTSEANKTIGSEHAFKLVTSKWLEQCLIQQ